MNVLRTRMSRDRTHYIFEADLDAFGHVVTVCARAGIADVQRLHQRMMRANHGPVQFAGFFDDIAKFAKKALKSKALKTATAILQNPLISTAISAAVPGGVALQPALTAVQQASQFVDAVDAGKPKARKRLRVLRRSAAKGDVRAKGALALAKKVSVLKRQGRAPFVALENLPKATIRALRPVVRDDDLVEVDDAPEGVDWPGREGYFPPMMGPLGWPVDVAGRNMIDPWAMFHRARLNL